LFSFSEDICLSMSLLCTFSNTYFLSKSCPCHWIPCWLLTNTTVTFAVTNFRCHKLIAKVNKWHVKFYLQSVWGKTQYFKHSAWSESVRRGIAVQVLVHGGNVTAFWGQHCCPGVKLIRPNRSGDEMHNLSLLCKALTLTDAGTDDGTSLLASTTISAVLASQHVLDRPATEAMHLSSIQVKRT